MTTPGGYDGYDQQGRPGMQGGYQQSPGYDQGYPGGYDQGYQQGSPYPAPGYPSAPTSEDRTMAAVTHCSALIAMLLSAGWLSFLGPLIMYFIYRDRSPFVRQAAAGSFNFNLSMWLMNVVAWILAITVIGLPISIILWIVSGLGQIIWHLIATKHAIDGQAYRYPMQIPVLH